MEELFPLVNEQGEVVGKATRASCHNGSMWLHPVVHLHVFNSRGQLYLQKRPMSKDIQPGMWDTSVGGHVDWGETIEQALRREAREEIGLLDFEPRKLFQYVFRSDRETELVHTYCIHHDEPLFPNPKELEEARFWNVEDIRTALARNIFTPNFEHEFSLLVQKKYIAEPL